MFKNIRKTWKNSSDGFKFAMLHDNGIKLHLIITLFLSVLLFFLDVPTTEKMFLFCMLGLLLAVALLNTAIATVDMISADYNILSKNAKDISSAAVLVVFIITLISWVTLLLDHFI